MSNLEAGALLVKLYAEWSHINCINSDYEEAITKAIAALSKDGDQP